MGSIFSYSKPDRMLKLLTALTLVASLFGSSTAKLTCDECAMEMHKLGGFAKAYGPTIAKFLKESYCPTIDSPDCMHHLDRHYVQLLELIVHHFIQDGANHICAMMMLCPARSPRVLLTQKAADKFTCDDCVAGLDFVQGYMLDEYVIEEFVVYLEQNFCLPDMPGCDKAVAVHFPPMHQMAMKEFFIPHDICAKADVCYV